MQNTLARARAPTAVRILAAMPRDAAFARAVAHLMTRPAFASAPFGHVARCLAGQVNRGHYAFAARGDRVVGFVGWALSGEAHAEAWLAGARGLGDAEAGVGDCAILNFWQADDTEVSRLIVSHLTATLSGVRRLYAKRHYPDGRMRPLRLDTRRRAALAIPQPQQEDREHITA